MIKTLTEYDYKPDEPVDYVTLRPYYLLSVPKSKNDSAEIFSIILKYYNYCDCAHTSIRIIFSVYATSVVYGKTVNRIFYNDLDRYLKNIKKIDLIKKIRLKSNISEFLIF